jgi:hypothetical protein
MSDDERAQHTHPIDDPQEWPGELKEEERPQHSFKVTVKFIVMSTLNMVLMVVFFTVVKNAAHPLDYAVLSLLVLYTGWLLVEVLHRDDQRP